MHMLMSYESGRRTEALVMSATRDTMRVIVPHKNETFELRHVDGAWLAENGEKVEIEALVTDGRMARPVSRALTATQ
jgi:hypothetical protein